MSFLDAMRRRFTKASATTRAVVGLMLGRPVWTPVNYEKLAKEGYRQNVYVMSCVRLIATSCAGIPWLLYKRGRKGQWDEIETHPLLDLLKRPNPEQGGARFFETVVSYLMLSGNSYIEAVGPEAGAPRELWPLRPDRMKVIRGDRFNRVGGYEYTVDGQKVRLQPELMLHLKLFNPLDDWYGMSPLEAAARSVDQNNESRAWNVALLQNSARPPGALVSEATLSDEQFARLENMLKEGYTGFRNAGRPVVLEGGLKWQEMGLSPQDMAWLEGLKLSAREIAIAFGVPPEMLGDSSNKTYSNFSEARKAFYEETVLPLMDWMRDELNGWLVPRFGDGLTIDYDKDAIEALAEDRQQAWARVTAATWLTVNEKRLATGYDEIEGGDIVLVPASTMPMDMLTGLNDEE